MNENITLLKEKFNEIRNMGYVKSIRKGSTGVGATFEYLIGKCEENFEIPDFYGIELKARRAYSKSKISLFNSVPTGSSYYEVKRLRDKYGYPSKRDKNLKRLYACIVGNEKRKVGLWNNFKLKVDRKNEKLVLEIYDYNDVLVDDATYWDFDILEEKLLRKLQFLAVISAWTNYKDNVEYFKYYKMEMYNLKGFNSFIDMIECGKIEVVIKIDSYVDEKRYGQVDSSGISFAIKEEYLLDLFDLYKI